MSEYARPVMPLVTFLDGAGREIAYGTRWAHLGGTPPEDSYSVTEHPERFAPLHTVATALIEHLTSQYDVEIAEGRDALAGDLRYTPGPDEIVRAVRITPNAQECAPLELILTTYPSVALRAGTLFSTSHPSCGCDACDETWEDAADRLESHAWSVVGGGLTKTVGPRKLPRLSYDRGHGITVGMGQTVSHVLRSVDGESWEGGESPAKDLPKPLLSETKARLTALASVSPAGNWLPWPLRAD